MIYRVARIAQARRGRAAASWRLRVDGGARLLHTVGAPRVRRARSACVVVDTLSLQSQHRAYAAKRWDNQRETHDIAGVARAPRRGRCLGRAVRVGRAGGVDCVARAVVAGGALRTQADARHDAVETRVARALGRGASGGGRVARAVAQRTAQADRVGGAQRARRPIRALFHHFSIAPRFCIGKLWRT